jgi:hypothetical protein
MSSDGRRCVGEGTVVFVSTRVAVGRGTNCLIVPASLCGAATTRKDAVV